MSRTARRVLGLLFAVATVALLVALSRSPYTPRSAGDALLRVSWSGRPERVERCRELSGAELAERPVHMRRRLECEGRSARYAVRVELAGRPVSLDTVTGGGLRGDRSIHMLRELPVAPGEHRVRVAVARVDTVEASPDSAEVPEDSVGGSFGFNREARERAERRRQQREALPPVLDLDTALAFAPGRVLLVTYDPSLRRLLVLGAPRP